MPSYPAELRRRETLPRLTSRSSGDLIAVDRGVFQEINALLAQALGSVERLNRRNAGSEQLWNCTKSRLETGKAGPGCPDAMGE